MESRLYIYIYIYIYFFFFFFFFFWLCEPFGRHVLRWSGSVTTYHHFLLLRQTYVLGNVRSELFFVYGCRLFTFLLFLFFTADIYTFIYFT